MVGKPEISGIRITRATKRPLETCYALLWGLTGRPCVSWDTFCVAQDHFFATLKLQKWSYLYALRPFLAMAFLLACSPRGVLLAARFTFYLKVKCF